MNNAEVLTENSQPVFNFMALCKLEIISQENISKGIISWEKNSGVDNSKGNHPLGNEEKVKAKAFEKVEAEAEAKGKAEDAKADAEAEAKAKGKEAHDTFCKENLNLLQYRLAYKNTNLSNLMFENRIP